MDLQKEITDRLCVIDSPPFLFVGSGFSSRYANLENWESLLKYFCEKIGISYIDIITQSEGDKTKAGSIIAKLYHEYFYTNSSPDEISAFEKKHKDQFGHLKDIVFKIAVSEYISEKCKQITDLEFIKENISDKYYNELICLQSAYIFGFITTNFDFILERIYPDNNVYIGQNDLLFAKSYEVSEIYKIHGCCSDPKSLIITQEDYKTFEDRQSYLVAKLLTIFIEHPIMFIGYSLEDKNIQNILKEIGRCLTNEHLKIIENRLFFILWDSENLGDQIYSHNFIFEDSISIPITVIRTDDFYSVFQSLHNIEMKIPIKILRILKKQLYEFILENEPEKCDNVYLINMDELDKIDDYELVIGTGIIKEYQQRVGKRITTSGLIKDFVLNQNICSPENARNIVLDWMHSFYYTWSVPIFKYLKIGGFIRDNGEIKFEEIKEQTTIERIKRINEEYFKSNKFRIGISSLKEEHIREIGDLKSIEEMYDPSPAVTYIPYLEISQINPKDLREYLYSNYEIFENPSSNYYSSRSYYRKLVVLLDWLEYGPK